MKKGQNKSGFKSPKVAWSGLKWPKVAYYSFQNHHTHETIIFEITIGDKNMTYLTLTPIIFGNSMGLLSAKENILGELILNCPTKITLPKSIAN